MSALCSCALLQSKSNTIEEGNSEEEDHEIAEYAATQRIEAPEEDDDDVPPPPPA